MTLAETREPPTPKPPKPPKPPKEEKPEPPPHEPGVLGAIHAELVCETGLASERLLVMSAEHDPYAIDTRENRCRADWLREAMQEAGILGRIIHVRGIFYALVAHGGIARHDGKPFHNTAANWHYIQTVVRIARWLDTIAFTTIIDERNTPPIIREARASIMAIEPAITIAAPALSVPPTTGDFTLEGLGLVDGFAFPHRAQPYNLVIFGEKTGLDPVLGPLAEFYNASLFLPSGEPSDSMLERMAALGARDGRPMIVFTFTDFDPTGNNMPAIIGRKLQALRDLHYPDLDFEIRPVAMTEAQVRTLNLPSTPLKETERRAEAWLARSGGLEQTEIDALAVLRPEILIEIAHTAIAPFFDADLAARQREAEEAWLEEARAALADIDRATLAPFEARLREEAQKVVPIARAFNAAADAWYDAARELADDVEFEEFEPAEPATSPESAPPPLVSSRMDRVAFIDALRARMIRPRL